jgi:hypothetical protein
MVGGGGEVGDVGVKKWWAGKEEKRGSCQNFLTMSFREGGKAATLGFIDSSRYRANWGPMSRYESDVCFLFSSTKTKLMCSSDFEFVKEPTMTGHGLSFYPPGTFFLSGYGHPAVSLGFRHRLGALAIKGNGRYSTPRAL